MPHRKNNKAFSLFFGKSLQVRKKGLRLLVFASLFSLCAKAQDYKADFEKASAIYKEKAFEVHMEYLFYPSYTATLPLEKEIMWIKKEGKQFNMSQFGLQTIYDDKHILLIDTESKIIAIDRKKAESKAKFDPKLQAQFDDAMKKFATSLGLDTIKAPEGEKFKVAYLGIKNGKKGYAVEYKYGEYEKTVIYLNAKSYNINNLIIYYRKPLEIEKGKFSKVRVEVNYVKQVANPVFPKETFSMKTYIDIKSDGEVIPKNVFKDYSVINHLLAKPKEEEAYK